MRVGIEDAQGAHPVVAGGGFQIDRLLAPRAVAIIGVSERASSAGRNALANLEKGEFGGDIHLVGRAAGEIAGRPCLASIDDLPDGVDLAVLALPSSAILDAVAACARKKVGAAVIFAAGFAEVGGGGEQEELARIAAEGGIAILGPNCLGYTNYGRRLAVGMMPSPPLPATGAIRGGAALVGQSGGILRDTELSLQARGIPVSFYITTGNEAVLSVSHFLDYLADDPATSVIAVYAEQLGDPAQFLNAAARAREAGKHVILLHSGRTERGQHAVQSHTGSLAGDFKVMKATVTRAGVLLAESLEAFVDTTELLVRHPAPPSQGVGVLCGSGAFCALTLDYCDDIGLDIPQLDAATSAALGDILPDYVTPKNPLDTGTAAGFDPEITRKSVKALLDDPGVGSLMISMRANEARLAKVLEGARGSKKPVAIAFWGDAIPEIEGFEATAHAAGIMTASSPERLYRALAEATAYGRRLKVGTTRDGGGTDNILGPLPALGKGVQPEWLGKQLLSAAGVATPTGGLARSAEEAVATAQAIGFPVVLKAQSAELAHKTEVGGVLLNLQTPEAVLRGWAELHETIARARPGLELDGLLVEQMAPKGLELVLGAKRDPRWGPVLLVGMGGVWVEALEDVRILPLGLSTDEIVEELFKLKAAKLLRGYRGGAAIDARAVAETARKLSQIMISAPNVAEIEVNPLVCYENGVCALDALVLTAE